MTPGSSYRRKISKNTIIAGSLLLYIISQVSIMIIARSLKHDMLMLQLTPSSDVFLKIVTTWKGSGLLNAYYNHFYLDFIHPVIYSVFLSSLLARGFIKRNIPEKFDILLLIPYLAGICDLVENSIHLYLLADFSRISSVIVLVSCIITWTKWILALSSLVIGTVMVLLPSKK